MGITIHPGVKYTLLFLVPIIVFMGCKKEQIVEQVTLISPSITIDSVAQTSLTTYKVRVHIDAGEGQEMKKAEVIFDDITLLTAPDIVIEFIPSNGHNQIDTIITLSTTFLDHDYNIQAKLTTNKYIYVSEKKIIRSNKNKFQIDILPTNEMYIDLKNNISNFLNLGDKFMMQVYYIYPYHPTSVEVKLNRTISINQNLDFSNSWSDGNIIESLGFGFIPNNIQPGVYEVYIYLDGFEFKATSKIKVLKGKWQTIDPKYPGDQRGEYAWFVKEDNVFLIGGEFENNQLTRSPVWKYNISNNLWESKNDFPHPGNVTENKIFPFNLQYGNVCYIVIKDNDSVEIWRYNDNADLWSFVTKYPGKSDQQLTCFIVDGKLFMGGGGRRIDNNLDLDSYYDFWAYDFETKIWVEKYNIPIKRYGEKGNLACPIQDNSVFVFSYDNEMWKYDPVSDTWLIKKKFPGPVRYISNLVSKNNKLYLVGGVYIFYGLNGLQDCWEYSPDSDIWEMVAFMPKFYSSGITFTYLNHIYAGLGWVLSDYTGVMGQNFYQLDF